MGAYANDPADEVAAAQADLRAAQERLAAAQARQAQQEQRVQQGQPQQAQQDAGEYTPQAPGPGSSQHFDYAYDQQPSEQRYAPQQPFSRQPYAQQSYDQQPVIPKDHVAAALLAIFLGCLGVHKFYLGYNTAGFIMLAVSVIGGIFTFSVATWIVWIIAIIEGVIYLTKSQTDFEQLYVVSMREWF